MSFKSRRKLSGKKAAIHCSCTACKFNFMLTIYLYHCSMLNFLLQHLMQFRCKFSCSQTVCSTQVRSEVLYFYHQRDHCTGVTYRQLEKASVGSSRFPQPPTCPNLSHTTTTQQGPSDELNLHVPKSARPSSTHLGNTRWGKLVYSVVYSACLGHLVDLRERASLKALKEGGPGWGKPCPTLDA